MNKAAAARTLGWRFWVITLATLLTMLVTASLGRWQLSRAAQKEAFQQAMDRRMAEPELGTATFVTRLRALDPRANSTEKQLADAQSDPLLHRSVVLTGQWLADSTVYLDNRQMQGKPGFYVMTPLKLGVTGSDTASNPVVMVQRGWVPRNFEDRARLPDISTPSGQVQIHGRIAARPARLFEFGASGNAAGASRIRQNLDLAAYGAETGLAILPLSVVQIGGDTQDGLLREWPAVDSGVDKHYGYAFQWFGLCSLVAILYVWFQIIRRFLRQRSQSPA